MRLLHVRSMCRCTLSLLTLLAAFGGRVYAQEVNASIHGIVQDNSGSVIPGAEVQVRSLDTNRVFRALTDESGNYNITQVPIGRYEVLAELQGFKKAVVTDIVLRVNDRRRVNFTLEVGGITEIVTVAASLVAVDTASGTTSSIMRSAEQRWSWWRPRGARSTPPRARPAASWGVKTCCSSRPRDARSCPSR